MSVEASSIKPSLKKFVESLGSKRQANNQTATKYLKKIIFNQLRNLEFGRLTIIDNGRKHLFIGYSHLELTAEIKVNSPEFYWFIALGGSVGSGEAYISDFWSCDDLTKVIQIFALNQSVMDNMEGGIAKFAAPLKKAFHWLNKNTTKGSKNNIVAHYDLGNEFFTQFLDPTLMYSSGIFRKENDSMESASLNKLRRICEKLKLSKDDHVIEIGTGWGSFAIYAAKNYGCRITTTTISDEQFAHVAKRIKEEGLEQKITLLKKDYRLLEGKFDKLVSIEMIEAVGHHYYKTFFKKCNELLKENGEMLIQAITIVDQRYESAKNEVDFIKRYIFPGSCIPSLFIINKNIQEYTDLRNVESVDFGIHYAETLKCWREQFFNNIERIKSLGFCDAFIRMWEFYLCYCEGGFREQVIGVSQIHFAKPQARTQYSLGNDNS